MSKYMPFEIQAEILKRLPVKPLVQFRSVSKQWKSLIESQEFTAAYGVRQTHPDRFILRYKRTLYLHYSHEGRYISLADNDDSFVKQDFVPAIPDFVKKLVPHTMIVVGSSHGLMCFKGYYEYPDGYLTDMAVLWNPSISKSVGIQVPLFYDYRPNANFPNVWLHNVFGFGVCPVTFDPTILKIRCTDYWRTTETGISVPWKVQVFTLSTGSWSVLSTNLPRESISLGGSQVVIDRFIYWLAFDMHDAEDDQSNYLIVSFDLTAKEFKEINLPDSLSNRFCRIRSISKLRESLFLLAYHRKSEEDISVCACLWMMKDQGVSRSFTKLYNINVHNARINQILGFRKNGEIIMETQVGFLRFADVQVYQQNREYSYNLGIHGEPNLFFMCSYLETLLLLDHSDGYIYTNCM